MVQHCHKTSSYSQAHLNPCDEIKAVASLLLDYYYYYYYFIQDITNRQLRAEQIQGNP